MARYHKISLGPVSQNCVQTKEVIAPATTPAGSIVKTNGSVATAADTSGVKLYIADAGWINGLTTDDSVAAGDTLIMQNPLPEQIYAALLADGVNMTTDDFALKVGASGQLVAATVGTDVVHFYGNEIYNNNTGSAQLVQVRKAY